MSAELELRRLSAAVGSEVVGFDASEPPSAPVAEALRAALDEHLLLLLRDQTLGESAQIALLEVFGPLLVEGEQRQSFQYVSNTRADGILGGEEYAFHSDHAFMSEPIEVGSLYAIEIPNEGGRTRFANALKAAGELPEALRTRASGRSARHIIDPGGHPASIRIRGERLPDTLPHAVHPILWEQAEQRTVLYVSAQQTDSVEGLADDESGALLEDLFTHLYSPAYVYEHGWRQGDLIVWDNRALQHARDKLDPGVERTLRRVSVGGTSVFEFFRSYDGPMTARPSSNTG